MRKLTAKKAALSALSMVLACLSFGQTEDIKVDLNLKKANLLDAARGLAVQTGLKFVFEPTTEPYARIDLKLDQVSADEAIQFMCDAAGASYRLVNGVYIIGKSKSNATALPKAADLPALPQAPRSKIVKKLVMRSADPQDVIMQLLGRVPNPMDKWARLNQFSDHMFKSTSYNVSNNGQSNANTTAQPVNTQKPVQIKGNGEGASDLLIPGEVVNQLEGGIGGGGIGGGFQGGGGGFQGGGGGFQGGGGGFQGGGGGFQGGGGLQGQGRGLVPDGIDYLVYDPNDNSIVVQGPQDAITQLQQNIARFDVAPKQVLIKLEFITTSSSLTKSLGYDFNYERGPLLFGAAPGTFARSSDPFFLSYSWGNVTTRLRAQLTEGSGKVVSAPIIRTLNNQLATLTSTQTTTIVQSTTSITNGTVTTATAPLTVNYNTGIVVAPRINGDGFITMYLTPTVTDQGEIKTIPVTGGSVQIPDALTQTVSVAVRVRSGQTIVLGGLTRRSDQGTDKKYPVLGDLPLIGQFFRSKQVSKTNSELLIFVTPTIVEDEENAGLEPL